jgi:hypothetical protein
MSDFSRRSFLKMSGTAAGAAAVSGSGGASLTGLVKETKKIKPTKKLSTYAKAYRQFLKNDLVKSSVKEASRLPFDVPTDSKYKAHVVKTVARAAFAEISQGLHKPDPSDSYMERKKGKTPTKNLDYLKHHLGESLKNEEITRLKDKGYTSKQISSHLKDAKKDIKHLQGQIREWGELEIKVAESKKAAETPGTRLYKEAQKNKPAETKKTTKRQLFGKAFKKIKGAIRGGFGGPLPRKIGIASRTPERVSGYHY